MTPTSSAPFLTVTDLSVRYGAVEAVHGLSLEVERGSITVLLGANGAGKSSTLAALTGIAPAKGGLQFDGLSLTGMMPEEIVRHGIALCPEGRRVFPSLSVADNLHLGGAAHVKGDALAARIEAELDRFPILRERFHQRAGLLSGGEQQMLAIARALMSAPRLLLLDEPSLGLAPKVVDQVFDLVLSLRDQGITILLVEQNAERALDIANRGYVLQSGRLVLSGSGAELAGSDLIRQAYLAG
jgi:branched-chain amino acid transport system ATP-binding protein